MRKNELRARVTGACAVITAALALGAAAGPAGAAGWTSPVDFDGANAVSAMNSRGDIGLVWATGARTLGVAYRPAGGTFASSTLTFNEDVSIPRIAINARGDVAAGAVGNAAMHVQVRHPDGTLGPPVTFTPGNGSIGGLDLDRIAMDDAGDVLAAWTTKVSGSSSLSYALAAADGTVLSSGYAGTPAGITFSVAMNGAGDAAVGWTGAASSPVRAMVATRAAGGSFAPVVDVSGTTTLNMAVSQVALNPAGDLAVALSAAASGSSTTTTRMVSRPRGGLFTAPTDASPGVDARYAAIGVDAGGNLAVTWLSGGALSLRTGTLAQPFTSPITQFAPASSPAVVAGSPNGAATVLYGVYASDGSTTVAAVSRPAGGVFGTPVTVGKDVYSLYGNIPYGTADADDTGDIATAWNTTNTRFRLTTYDATPPELRALSVPGSAVAGGAPVAFSVAPWDAFSAVGTPHWDFGDGSAGADGAAVSHAFAAPGTYRVTVTATDAAGNTGSAAGTVTVAAAPSTVTPPPAGRSGGAGTAAAACRVPSLTNLTPSAAKRKLVAAGCALGRTTTPRKYRKRRGLVIRSQSRRARATLPAGTKVNVTLGPRPRATRHRRARRRSSRG